MAISPNSNKQLTTMENFKKSISFPQPLHPKLMICMVKDGFTDLNGYMTFLFENRVRQDNVDLEKLYADKHKASTPSYAVEPEINPSAPLKTVEAPKTPSPRVWGLKKSK